MREHEERETRRRRGWLIWGARLLPVFLAGVFVQFGADRVLSQGTSSPAIELRDPETVEPDDEADPASKSETAADVEVRGVAVDARRVAEETAESDELASVAPTLTPVATTEPPAVSSTTAAPTTRPTTTRPTTTRPTTSRPADSTTTTEVVVAPIFTIQPTIVAPNPTTTSTRPTTSTTRPTPTTGPTVLVVTAPPTTRPTTTTTAPTTTTTRPTTTTTAPTTTTTAAAVPAGPVISNLRMASIGSTRADIRFSNQVCTAVRFDYSSPSGDSGAHVSAGYPSTNHCWFNHSGQLGNPNWGLPALLPDTDYNVSITVVDEFGQTASSFISFRTNP